MRCSIDLTSMERGQRYGRAPLWLIAAGWFADSPAETVTQTRPFTACKSDTFRFRTPSCCARQGLGNAAWCNLLMTVGDRKATGQMNAR